MPKLTGTSHVDLTVSDLDRSVAFYEKALAMTPLMRARIEEEKFEVCYLVEPQTGMILGLVKHDAAQARRLRPARYRTGPPCRSRSMTRPSCTHGRPTSSRSASHTTATATSHRLAPA